MRLPSTIITLFFSAAVLTAQTPTANTSTVQFVPRPNIAVRSCPVRFSVDRQPQGAVAFVGSLGSWSRLYGDHTLEQQQQLLKAEPGFDQLTPEQQQEKLDQLSALYRSDAAHHRQGLGITIGNEQHQVVAADIVVHGYPAGTRIIPATLATNELTETFHLIASQGHSLINSPIWTAHVAMVNWLELTRIEYADGTTWQPSAASRCSASPSLFVLVNATAR